MYRYHNFSFESVKFYLPIFFPSVLRSLFHLLPLLHAKEMSINDACNGHSNLFWLLLQSFTLWICLRFSAHGYNFLPFLFLLRMPHVGFNPNYNFLIALFLLIIIRDQLWKSLVTRPMVLFLSLVL